MTLDFKKCNKSKNQDQLGAAQTLTVKVRQPFFERCKKVFAQWIKEIFNSKNMTASCKLQIQYHYDSISTRDRDAWSE